MNMKLIGESSALRKLQILKIHQMHPIECPSLSCKYENSIENQAWDLREVNLYENFIQLWNLCQSKPLRSHPKMMISFIGLIY